MKRFNIFTLLLLILTTVVFAVPGINDALTSNFSTITVNNKIHTNKIKPFPIFQQTFIDSGLTTNQLVGRDVVTNDMDVNFNLNVSGSLNAQNIGVHRIRQFINPVIYSQNFGNTSYVVTLSTCPQGEYLISCNGTVNDKATGRSLGSSITDTGACYSNFLRNSSTNTIYQTLICFDPNSNE